MKTSFTFLAAILFSLHCLAVGNVSFIKDKTKVPDDGRQSFWRKQTAWKNFTSKHPDWRAEFNEITGFPHRAYGAGIQTSGSSPRERVLNFIGKELIGFPVAISDLIFRNENTNKKYTYLSFYQTYNGLKILNTNLTFRLTQGGGITLFGLDIFKNITADITPAIDAAGIKQFAVIGLEDAVSEITVNPSLAVLPVEEKSKYVFHLVYEVIVKTEGKMPGNYYILADAHNGEILYRQNRVHTTVDVKVKGTVTDNGFVPVTNMLGLPEAHVKVGVTDYYTDTNGVVFLPGSPPVTSTFYMEGKYAKTHYGTLSTAVKSVTKTINTASDSINFDLTANNTEIAGYYHTNSIHKHMKQWTPAGFTAMDNPMDVIVDITSDNCNAFYDGNLNFYAEGNGCLAFVLFNDVVYHEYGHGINYEFYSYLGGYFGNSALGEGYSDVWALTLTRNPVLSYGYAGTAGSFIRRYDKEPAVYPKDLQGEPHADGEIIAGAWWDLGQNLDSIEKMMEIFIGTHNATLSEPDGSEGILYRDILLEALLYDDDDANLTNGTPNGTAICNAFGRHGITLVSNAELTHAPLDSTLANIPVDISATLNIGSTTYLGSVGLRFRTNTNPVWNEILMTNTGGNNYSAQIPAQPVGTIISYYLGVTDNICGYLSSVIPSGAAGTSDPNIPYYILVGYKLVASEDFDFNTFGAWTLGLPADDATTGLWYIDDPVGSQDASATPPVQVQPEDQHTPGGYSCAVTGNDPPISGIGTDDIDDGATTLESPAINLSQYDDPVITYFRWFINDPPGGANPGNDPWVVHITEDGTTWKPVESTYTSDNSWRRYAFRVADYITPSSNAQMRFIASDSLHPGQGLQYDGGSISEAALDDIMIWEKLPTQVTVQHTDPGCFGSCDGTATATLASNAPPFTYQWNDSGSQSTQTATGLCAGPYTVQVLDSNNQSYSAFVYLNNPDSLTGTTTQTDASCYLCPNGTSTVAVSGGTGNFIFLWSDSNAQTTSAATGLLTGIYSVTVTDTACNKSIVLSQAVGYVAVEEISPSEGINIFPNPSGGTFIIKPAGTGSGKYEIKIFNILGEVVYSDYLRPSQPVIDLGGQPAGIYNLELKNNEHLTHKKLILE